MATTAGLLERLLGLERIERDLFRCSGPHVVALGRVFGGQVAAQALVAAGQTLGHDCLEVHSLHSYFLGPGDPSIPILFEVDEIRDGRSFSTRRVVAIQHGEAIFNLQCSFQVEEPGLDHQDLMPSAPSPADLPEPEGPGWLGWPGLQESALPAAFGVEVRVATSPALGDRQAESRTDSRPPPRRRIWLRALELASEDPLIQAAGITYLSDLTILAAVLRPNERNHPGQRPVPSFAASLDHCMWFHRKARADAWLLYDQHSPSASGSRGLALGSLFDSGGRLAVSVAQEGLVRFPAPWTRPRDA